MCRKLIYLVSFISILSIVSGVQADTITVGSDADTYMRDDVVRGPNEFMDIRGGSLDFGGYLRFDLSGLNIATVESATLTLIVSGGASRNDTANNGRFSLYGLDNVEGNTFQDWDENVLTEANVGIEWILNNGDPLFNVTDLDGDVNGITETVVRVEGTNYSDPGGTIITITGDALVSFIQGRVGDNGLVTFIIKNDEATDRGYGIATKENANEALRPKLELEVVPKSALVHQYTFEDGTANDSVGDAHGTLVGDAYIADGALVTVDQDDWMEMPGDIIAMNAYNEVTIEAWYTPEAGANTSWSMLAYFGDNVNGLGNDGFFITSARGDNKSRAAISIGDIATPWASESGADGPEYDDGILHQMVGTINATDITLYIDGVLIASTPLSATNTISGISQNFAYLAKGGYSGDPEWIGAIEEFNIYNKALTTDEIAANYAKGPVTPLVHRYTFEDGTANDSVGDADGVVVGDAYIDGGALITVDQDDWMEMPGDMIAMNTYNEVTIEAWYTPEAGANTSWSMLAYFGDNVNGLGNDGFFITSARGDNKSRAAISIGDIATPWASESGADGPEYDDGILHQMVGTINATDITLYIDGVLIASTPLSESNKISGISQKLAYLAKGGYDGDPEWIGSIQEFNIYNRALSEAEIAANYAKGPQKGVNPGTEGLVAYYALENNTDDSSGNGLNGTVETIGGGNAATYVAGPYGMALDFLPSAKGTVGSVVNCGADPLFDLTDAITVGAWVNFRSVPDEWRAIVAKGDSAWRIGNVGATTKLHFGFCGYASRPTTHGIDGTIEVGFDSWHYVCGTYDITYGAKLYVDGVLDVEVADTAGIALNTYNVWIGGNEQDTGWKPYRLFDGMIDEVKIYNRALSAAEILYLVNN